jgi:autophagy-related protein 11
VRLEQELAAEKEARANLEKEAQTKEEEDAGLRRQAEEAISTKDEIMENMKAQQREFATERRSLEQEIQSYKGKIEEAEDELDRVLGSRDHERSGVDIKIQDLVSEIEKTRREAEEQSKEVRQQLNQLQHELNKRKESETQYTESLSAAFNRLSPDGRVPEDHGALVSQIEDLALRSFNHQQELQQAIAMAKAENNNARARAQEHETDLKSRLSKEEAEASSLREQLERAKAKTASITSELEEERSHLHSLREKFTEGETGSEALRKRVEEEEVHVGRLKIELAESKSHANSLNLKLIQLQQSLTQNEESDASRTHERSLRAKELSKRLYSQQDRLLRLVEALGFVLTYEDGAMSLQRASRMSNSTTLGDTTTLVRSTTTPSPTPLKQFFENPVDLAFLQWPESTSTEEEDSRYHELMDNLNRFDLETFTDAVAKRMRDVEYMAKKYQRTTRDLREKAHRYQADAYEKIAYRSFKEGDLALFLPTRNQATRPWAAFNVGAPHYFLREQDSHRLHGREWLVARISKVEERVVDLSKTMDSAARASIDGRSIASNSAISFEDDNPFELSDGLRWYLIDATEEKPGAPGTPGLGKTTVASARVTGQGQMEPTRKKSATDPAKTLGKSLDSRRSSGTSRKSAPLVGARNSSDALPQTDGAADSGPSSNTATRGASPSAGPGPSHLRETQDAAGVDKLLEGQDEVRKDLLWGP